MKGIKPQLHKKPVKPYRKDSGVTRIPRRRDLPFNVKAGNSLDETFLIQSKLPSISEKDDETKTVGRMGDGKGTHGEDCDTDWLSNSTDVNDVSLIDVSTGNGDANDVLIDTPEAKVQLDPFHLKKTHKSSGQVPETDLNRLITEEDLLDTIFFSCDEHKTGRVPPSVLLEYVTMIMLSSHLDDTPDMEDLAHMLDPTGMDLAVDLPTYQQAMANWIRDIQANTSMKLIDLSAEEESVRVSPLPATSTPMLPPSSSSKKRQWSSRKAFTQTLHDDGLPSPLEVPYFSYGDTSDGTEGNRKEVEADLISQIENLKFQVKKLSDQNAKLQVQMESTEENNTHLLTELDTIHTKLKSSELVIQRSMSVREENEELHSAVNALEDCKSDIQRQYKMVVDERDILQVKLKNLMDEVEQAYAEIDERKESMQTMQDLLNKLQIEYQEAEERLAMQTVELAEKSMQFEELQGQVRDLLSSKEVLQTEKDHLEEKVVELKGELAVACQILPDNVAYLQTGDNTEEDLLSPAMIHPPVTSSTPYKQPLNPAASVSIYSELKAVSTGNALPPVYGILPVDPDNQKERMGASTSDEAVEMVLRLQSKKQAILKEVEEIMKDSSEKGEATPTNGLSKEVVTCISKEMDHVLDQMKVVAKAKQNSDERAKKLSKLLKEITSEKESLLRQYEEAVSKHQQLNYDQHQLELVRAENEILEHSIEQEKSRLSLAEQRLSECQYELQMAQEREKKWKWIAVEALMSQSEQVRKAKNHSDQISGKFNSKPNGFTRSQLSLLDALSLEIFPAKSTTVHSQREGSGVSWTQREVHQVDPNRSRKVIPGPSHVTSKCEPHLRRARSWDLTFITATDQSSLSSLKGLGEDSEISGSWFNTATTQLVYNLKGEEPATPNLSEVSFTSFRSGGSSVDSNNNLDLRSLRQESGDGSDLRARDESREQRSDFPNEELSKVGGLSVRVFREVAIQTTPTNCGARLKKFNKHNKDTLPKLNLPLENSITLEEEGKGTRSIPNSPSQSPPHSPLLTIPKLARPDSPHSHDSDSLSSSFSFKTANSSPPESPGAKSNDSSREADVSSEGFSSQTSSSSPPDLFFSCTEGDLSRKLSEKMEKDVDENFNKGLTQSDSGLSSAFKSVSKPKRSDFDRERSYSATAVDEDGSLIDLINADLADEPLTEADKEINAKLLKESQLASERFWNRKGRRHGTPTQLPKTTEKTSSESPSGSRGTHREMSNACPSNANQEGRTQENSPKTPHTGKTSENAEDDNVEDIKAEILKTVGSLQRETNLSKSPQELEKMRKENKSLHRKATFVNKMPELAEASETESAREAEESAPEADKQSPPPLVRKRSSILSDTILRSLGLMKGNDVDPLKMSDKELEMKFTDLSMTMKSSKDTLVKRVELQRRERDLAEENIGKELDVLLGAVQTLECYEADSALYRQASQLQQQVGMLQSMMLNLSRVAEGLGQVLQEQRISTACEVMVKYVENLRLALERKQAELEEARKVIQDNRLFLRPGAGTADVYGVQDLKSHNRRSSSVNPYMKSNHTARLGATLSTAAWKKLVQDEDSRGRFSSLVSNRTSGIGFPSRPIERANTVQVTEQKPSNVVEKTRRVTSFMPPGEVTSQQREVSQLAVPNDSSSSSASGNRKSSLKGLTERRASMDRKDSNGDESFRLGYEQGIQNQVSQELEDLREQQRMMVENLEELMDSMDEDDKEEISRSSRSYPQLSHLFVHPSAIPWVKVQKVARLAATFFLVLAACFSVVFTLMPVSSFGAGAIVFESPWSTIKQFFWPYSSLSHTDPAPR